MVCLQFEPFRLNQSGQQGNQQCRIALQKLRRGKRNENQRNKTGDQPDRERFAKSIAAHAEHTQSLHEGRTSEGKQAQQAGQTDFEPDKQDGIVNIPGWKLVRIIAGYLNVFRVRSRPPG